VSAELLRIAVAGGGIRGPTLALTLRQRGFAVAVSEQTAHLTKTGAAPSASSTRKLRRFGVQDAVAALQADGADLP